MRIGVYVCHCGSNIAEVVDIDQVVRFAEQQGDVVMVKDHTHMCSEVGQRLVIDDIKEHKLDRVVIAACSPQFQGATFMTTVEKAGLNPYVFEMANIREQCSWPHFSFKEEATEKAKSLTNMAITKARLDEPLEKLSMPVGKRVLVVGGGIAGIQAALDLGNAGFKVYLVEKEPSIGGHMVKLSRTFPTEDCAACILSPKMADVPANPNIELMTSTELLSVDGFLGNYQVTVRKKPTFVDPSLCTCCEKCEDVCPVVVPNEQDEGLTSRRAIYLPNSIAVPHTYILDSESCLGLFPLACTKCSEVCEPNAINYDDKPQELTFTVDTIIVSTGYQVFDATQKAVYGFGKFDNVYTSLELERIIAHATEGEPITDLGKRIAFIQCVGSRDEQCGNEYCSRICCMYASKLAQLLKRTDKSKDVYIFYTDLRAYGKGFEEYYKRAQREGVKFIRGRVAQLQENMHNGRILLKAEDTLSRDIIESEFDSVILSVGMIPHEGTGIVAELLRLAKGDDGFLKEAHPKFRPVDTLSEGVFVAGTVQGPKDIPDSVAQGSAAAARAITLMNPGKFIADPYTSLVDEDVCSGCGACVAVCPYSAISLEVKNGKRISNVNTVLCKCCGNCAATCPSGAMEQRGFTSNQILAMVEKALE